MRTSKPAAARPEKDRLPTRSSAPAATEAGGVAALQQGAGNRAVQRLLAQHPPGHAILPGRPLVGAGRGRLRPRLQRLLAKDQPINAADVQTVTNPHGNVYLLDGLNNDSVVVKFEVAGAEGVDRYRARYELGEELGAAVLSGAMRKNQLTAHDITELGQIPVNAADDSGALHQVMQAGIAQAAVGIKMDRLAMGTNLFDMAANNAGGAHDAALDNILTTAKCRRYGEMAYFDLLVRNFDRFREDGTVAAKNIDYDAANAETLPLDNIFYQVSLIGGNWQAELTEMHAVRPANRQAYATTAIQNLIAASGRNFTPLRVASAEQMFVIGMNQAEARAGVITQRWRNQVRFQGGRGRQNADPDKQDTKLVLVARYEAGQ